MDHNLNWMRDDFWIAIHSKIVKKSLLGNFERIKNGVFCIWVMITGFKHLTPFEVNAPRHCDLCLILGIGVK